MAQAPAAPTAPVDAPSGEAVKSAAKPEPYLRIVDDADGTVGLDLATRVLERPTTDGRPAVRLHLVSAVHIADASYYEAMQKQLDALSLVLFEGVKPPGAGTLPADADDAARARATQGRLTFLKTVAEQAAARATALPKTLDALPEAAGARWKSLVASSLVDGWGRPFRAEFRRDGEGEEGAPVWERLAIVSDGADGKADAPGAGGVGAKGDDLRATAEFRVGLGGLNKAEPPNLQSQMAKALGLTFQLDAIDSGKPNWQSCDVSMDELKDRLKEVDADDSMLLTALDGSSMLSKLAGLVLSGIAKSPTMQATLKLVLVQTLGTAEDTLSGVAEGGVAMPGKAGKQMAALMRVILLERNEVVLRDVRALVEGKAGETSAKTPPSDIAIFYGGGHMPDLERRLCAELGFRAGESTWARAITVDPAAAGMTQDQAKKMRDAMKRMMERQAKRASGATK